MATVAVETLHGTFQGGQSGTWHVNSQYWRSLTCTDCVEDNEGDQVNHLHSFSSRLTPHHSGFL